MTFHLGHNFWSEPISDQANYLFLGPLVTLNVAGLKVLKSPLVLLVKVSPTLLVLLLLKLNSVLLSTSLVLKSSTTIPMLSLVMVVSRRVLLPKPHLLLGMYYCTDDCLVTTD
jgi:hypothetical protein